MTFLERLTQALQKHRVPFAVVGGYAVALHGAVRGTVDIDVIIRFRKKDFLLLEQAMKALGLFPRLPVTAEEVFQFREEYIAQRNLIAWSFVNPERPIEIVDVLLTEDLKDNKVVQKRIGNLKLPVLGIEDLIKMKRQAGRPQDIEDVRALESIRKAAI